MKVLCTMIAVPAMLLAGCAATAPPSELVFARAAYRHISTGQAQALVPAEVRKAGDALALAERSFEKEPRSFGTRDLAYAASRTAHRAEVLGNSAATHAAKTAVIRSLIDTITVGTEAIRVKESRYVHVNAGAADRMVFEQNVRCDEEMWAMIMAPADLVRPAQVREEPRDLADRLSDDLLASFGVHRWRMWVRTR